MTTSAHKVEFEHCGDLRRSSIHGIRFNLLKSIKLKAYNIEEGKFIFLNSIKSFSFTLMFNILTNFNILMKHFPFSENKYLPFN